jgi:hypothetical protein
VEGVIGPRLFESVVMLPILHAPNGQLVVACAGPMAEDMAAEALRWREVVTCYLMAPPRKLRDRRIQVVTPLPLNACHVVCLTPEQDPKSWLRHLAKGGVICASSVIPAKWGPMRADLAEQMGNATPWRNYLPQPLYGCLAANQPEKVTRIRQPPKGAKHLSSGYLPSLFTFAKDEMPVAFTRQTAKVSAAPVEAPDERPIQPPVAAQRLHSAGERAPVPSSARPGGGAGS